MHCAANDRFEPKAVKRSLVSSFCTGYKTYSNRQVEISQEDRNKPNYVMTCAD